MNKTIRQNIIIAASVEDIMKLSPQILKESEVIPYAYNVLATDIEKNNLSKDIWTEISELDFKDKDKELKFAETRGVSVENKIYDQVIEHYLDTHQRAPLAYVTRLVLLYARKKLHEQYNAKEQVEIASNDDFSNMTRLEKYIKLLKKTDTVSVEKIKEIDNILLMED
ncbi:MAG: hypothetical protein HDR13_16110 [Lachnospiraceae bacterium]|nr:hypothetical protein [Lachnospiraceae bacterium]